jgi:small-conductance mechanosensitive channel
MKYRAVKVFQFLLLPVAILLMSTKVLTAQDPKVQQPSPAIVEEPTSEETLASVVPLASELAGRLIDLEKNIETGFDLSEAEKSFERITNNLEGISSRLAKLKTSQNYGITQLAELKGAIQNEADSFKIVTEGLTEAISQLELSRKSWSEEKIKWKELRSSLPGDVPLSSVKPAFSKANQSIESALSLIAQKLKPMLAAQEKAGEIQTRLRQLAAEVDALLLAVRADVLRKSAPSMFSPDYYSEFDRGLLGEPLKGLRFVSWPGREFFSQNAWVVFLQVLLALALSIGILRHKQLLEGTERWQFLAKRPFSAGLLVSVSALISLYKPVPAIWNLVVLTAISIATARLVGVLFTIIWKRRLVYGLALLLITIELFQIFGLPLPIFRLFVFCVSLVGTFLCIWRSLASARRRDSALYIGTLSLGGFVFIVALAAELGGYSALALYVLESSLGTIFILLIAWMLMLLTAGCLELAANSSPFQKVSFLSSKADVMVRRFELFINVIIAAIALAFILVVWGFFESHPEAIRGVFSLGFNVGSWRITAGLVLTAAAVLYGSFLASWAIQAVLLESAFSTRQIETGVQISVTKLVHYGLIFLGFLVALGTLGFDLKNITIIGGALGIGIGFGLQAVVNNFVCGLILLFERPIRVGDYIEYGGQWAEVKKIGLRSTIVGTFDRADIVVPNSILITNDVINWTRSDRFARVRIPVGVAYGSDVSLVMKSLLECAKENPTVMRVPEPRVYFMGFGESSLNFELRVHISDIDKWYPVQTELLQKIDQSFQESGVEIPFPQRDLHVRSLEEAPTPILKSPEDQHPDLAAITSQEGDEAES